MKRQIEVYSYSRTESGPSRQCTCVLCNKVADGDFLDRHAGKARLLLPEGWQEGIKLLTDIDSQDGCFLSDLLSIPNGDCFVMGFFCGDCHASAVNEWLEMASEKKALILQELVRAFECWCERLDRAGDERCVTRDDAVWLSYHHSRRALRMMGRIIYTYPASASAFVPSERQRAKHLSFADPVGHSRSQVRHIMTGDIGNIGNPSIR